MDIILIALIIIGGCFCFVVFFGAPYVPTLSPQVAAALRLANLKDGDRLLELGCGDGKVLIAAAKQGIHCIGYEINPILAVIAWLRTRRYRGRVHVVCGNFWRITLPETDAIFVFLLDKYMKKLNTKIEQESGRPVKLVSYAFQIPDKEPTKLDSGVFLYVYK